MSWVIHVDIYREREREKESDASCFTWRQLPIYCALRCIYTHIHLPCDNMEQKQNPTVYKFAQKSSSEFPLLDVEMTNIIEEHKTEQREAERSRDFSAFSFISGIPIRASVLGLLMVQNSALAICMRYSRMRYLLCLDCNIVRMACPSCDTIVIMQ